MRVSISQHDPAAKAADDLVAAVFGESDEDDSAYDAVSYSLRGLPRGAKYRREALTALTERYRAALKVEKDPARRAALMAELVRVKAEQKPGDLISGHIEEIERLDAEIAPEIAEMVEHVRRALARASASTASIARTLQRRAALAARLARHGVRVLPPQVHPLLEREGDLGMHAVVKMLLERELAGARERLLAKMTMEDSE